jgi:hypothetical protein
MKYNSIHSLTMRFNRKFARRCSLRSLQSQVGDKFTNLSLVPYIFKAGDSLIPSAKVSTTILHKLTTHSRLKSSKFRTLRDCLLTIDTLML